MMPFTRTKAQQWFKEALECDLRDKFTYGHFIDMVERDRREVSELLPHYENAPGFEAIAAECKEDIAFADDLLGKMRARLAELG